MDQIGISAVFFDVGDKDDDLRRKEKIFDSSNLDIDAWVGA